MPEIHQAMVPTHARHVLYHLNHILSPTKKLLNKKKMVLTVLKSDKSQIIVSQEKLLPNSWILFLHITLNGRESN